MRRGANIALLAGALAGLPSCRSLPEYAKPSGEVRPAEAASLIDPISYRRLTREDFRAAQPRAAIAEHADMMGAYTYAVIVPEPETRIRVHRDGSAGLYTAQAASILFRAQMDREQSWWNPKMEVPAEYLLQHEQIHFALFELAARDLTAQAQRATEQGPSPAEAMAKLQQKVEALLTETLERVLARSTEFDLDTSGRHEPARQSRWYQEVQAELAP